MLRRHFGALVVRRAESSVGQCACLLARVGVSLCVCVCVTVVAVAVAVAAAVACVFVAVVYGKQLELWWMAPRGVQKSASNSPGIPRELPSRILAGRI